MVKKINTEEFNSMDKSGVMVVDFNATWCGPCKMMGPVLEETSEAYEGRARFYAIDTDENTSLAISYKISSIPAILIFKDGEPVDRSIGFINRQELESVIDRNL